MTSQDDIDRSNPFTEDPYPEIAYNRVWFNLQRIQRSLGTRIARALRAAGFEDPVWYEFLLELERAGADGLPMAELEERLFMPQYALSRHAKRLETLGWIYRQPRPGPGRGQTLRLTEAGHGMHAQIWQDYERIIQEELAHRMCTCEAYALARQLIRLYP